jgi:uncharacterized protein YjbI with pentapeptide repeats
LHSLPHGCFLALFVWFRDKTGTILAMALQFLPRIFLGVSLALSICVSLASADADEAQHTKLLLGQHVFFATGLPAEARTIKAEWIKEAAERQVPIQITNAVIAGHLLLSTQKLVRELRLVNCTFDGVLDLSNAVLARDFYVDGGEFKNGVTLNGAIFEANVNLSNVAFSNFDMSEATVLGAFGVMGATFSEHARFTRARFSGATRFINAKFASSVDFDYAEFHAVAKFDGSIFTKYASFDNVQFLSDVAFGGAPGIKGANAQFLNRATFRATRVVGEADMRGVSFIGDADFTLLKVTGELSFNGASFANSATFTGLEAESDVDFAGVLFKGPFIYGRTHTKGILSFVGTSAGRYASFQNQATFDYSTIDRGIEISDVIFFRTASFGLAKIGGFFVLQDCQFKQDLLLGGSQIGAASFRGIVVIGKANFRSVHFYEKVSFQSSDKTSTLDFFDDADFSDAIFDKHVIWKDTKFHKNAEFSGTQFGSQLEIQSTSFDGKSNFSGSEFAGPAYFGKNESETKASLVRFSDVMFDYSQFRKDAHFESSIFSGKLGLRGVQFRSVLFASNGRVSDQEQFSGPIDLRGTAYDFIDANWDHLLKLRDGGTRTRPYDPQIYLTLEHVLRGEGRDSQADHVYLLGRDAERSSLPLVTRAVYFLWGSVLGYGTGYRVWIISFFIVFFGAFFFWLTAAKEAKPQRRAALGYGFRQFLPIDLPFKSEWEPSRVGLVPIFKRRFLAPSSVAVSLRIIGWILVPILVYATVEIIRRTPK